MTEHEHMPIQVGADLDRRSRHGERVVHIKRVPRMMLTVRHDLRCQTNHGQSLEEMAERGGPTAGEMISILTGLPAADWGGEEKAQWLLATMVNLFTHGQRIAKRKAQPTLPTTILTLCPALLESFGEGFHAALRKGVDSKHSVVLWNIISLVDHDIYNAFCIYMIDAIKDRSSVAFTEFADLLRNWSSQQYQDQLFATRRREWERMRQGADFPVVHIFDASINGMSNDDIAAVMGFLDYSGKFMSGGQ